MSLRTTLAAQLSRFDDEAWIALANRGLLRRATKDLAAAEPEIIAEEADGLRVRTGSWVVTFDQTGPAGASCSCPSGSACQHIITAGLWLAAASSADSAPAPDTAGALHAELMALDTAALVAHAGRAGFRWARQYVEDLDPEAGARIETGRQVVVTLSSPRVTFRFMGGGAAGLVPDGKLPAVEKYQAAVVLAYQRANGAELAPVEAPKARTSPGAAESAESRRRLRAAVAQLLTDTVRLGVAHLSPSMQQRYETLAVSAQGAEYHRLALLLRRLADHVELQLERSARADEHRLLEEAAIAYALVRALESAGDLPRLVGRARNRYDAVRRLEVIGLGALPWRAASGYRGLTSLFWWPEEHRFLFWTDARPDTLRDFDPRARYHAPAPWTGLSAPAAATGARLRLADAQLSAAGRLSGVESTRATVVPVDGDELRAALPVVTAWADLERRPPLSLLDQPDPLRDWAVLRPEGAAPPHFDPVGQTLHWTLLDGDGAALELRLPYTAENAHAIERVEAMHGDLPAGALVVARVRLSAAGLVGEPLSLVRPERAAGAVDALHFGAVPAGASLPKGARPGGEPVDSAETGRRSPQLEDL
ncbi:MAG TPA: hypothetical protein VGJ44_00410, partial [Kribbellaceae bacterium]